MSDHLPVYVMTRPRSFDTRSIWWACRGMPSESMQIIHEATILCDEIIRCITMSTERIVAVVMTSCSDQSY